MSIAVEMAARQKAAIVKIAENNAATSKLRRGPELTRSGNQSPRKAIYGERQNSEAALEYKALIYAGRQNEREISPVMTYAHEKPRLTTSVPALTRMSRK